MKPTNRILFALALAQGGPAAADQFCVADGDALQDALAASAGNSEDDDIRLRGGVYTRVEGIENTFVYSTAENFDLTVSGGWNAACSDISLDASSILDGGDARRVMLLSNWGAGTEVAHSVSRLTFRNGRVAANGGGLDIGGVQGNRVDIEIQHCLFISNVAGGGGGGLAAGSAGIMRIDNNLFIGNDAESSMGAATLTSNEGVAYVVNNTVMFNTAAMLAGGLRFGGSSTLQLANNILWGNSDTDLLVDGSSSHNRYHNNIGALSAPMAGVVAGEITTEPEFQPGLLSFTPRVGGALYNGGDSDPPGGLATTDLPGRPRVVDGEVDIGAYEAQVLFRDGFDP